MKEMLPHGLLGLTIVGLLAGVMSTVSDNINFGSQVMVSDLYKRWVRPHASERHYCAPGKVCMVLIARDGAAGRVTRRVHVRRRGVHAAAERRRAAGELVQWWWWRFNGKARMAASFGGAGIFCIVVLGPKALYWLGSRVRPRSCFPGGGRRSS